MDLSSTTRPGSRTARRRATSARWCQRFTLYSGMVDIAFLSTENWKVLIGSMHCRSQSIQLVTLKDFLCVNIGKRHFAELIPKH